MKFQQFPALQKHIHSSASVQQVPKCYLVIHSQREERRKLLEGIAHEIATFYPHVSSQFLEQEEAPWSQVFDTLMTPSLFGDEQLVAWNGLKNPAEQVLENLSNYILAPSSKTFFLIGAESAKGFSDLYQKTKKELVLLDFSEEKPWDKQKRVQQEMLLLVKKEGKAIAPDAWTKLSFLCGADPLVLESELVKVMTYVGDRKQITEEDIDAIASSSSTATGWQLSEGLVWADALTVPASSIDLTFLLSLFGQIRFYLQQGRQVGWCLQQKMTQEEISKHLPQLKPAQFQKVANSLRHRKMAYFDEALAALYEIELLSKNSNLTPVFLFDLLQVKLTHLKQLYTR